MIVIRKRLVILHGEIQTPPMSDAARSETGHLIRHLQRGSPLEMPHSRPMTDIAPRVHELRIVDESQTWRIIYRIDSDAIVIAEVFSKKTTETPHQVIATCRKRFAFYGD